MGPGRPAVFSLWPRHHPREKLFAPQPLSEAAVAFLSCESRMSRDQFGPLLENSWLSVM